MRRGDEGGGRGRGPGLNGRVTLNSAVPPRATYREVFAVREFRVLWSSVILSTAGDRLALVALTLLVFDRTHSPLLTAAVYAVGYVPWVIGGLFLAELRERDVDVADPKVDGEIARGHGRFPCEVAG